MLVISTLLTASTEYNFVTCKIRFDEKFEYKIFTKIEYYVVIFEYIVSFFQNLTIRSIMSGDIEF